MICGSFVEPLVVDDLQPRVLAVGEPIAEHRERYADERQYHVAPSVVNGYHIAILLKSDNASHRQSAEDDEQEVDKHEHHQRHYQRTLVEHAAKQEEERMQRDHCHPHGNHVRRHANFNPAHATYRLHGIDCGRVSAVAAKDERKEILHHVAREESGDGGERQRHYHYKVASDELLLGRGWQHEVVDALLTGLEMGKDACPRHDQINEEGEQGRVGR